MSKIKADDIIKIELSKEEAIKLMGEDIAPQFDEYGNRCIKGDVKLSLRFKNKKGSLHDSISAIVFVSNELTEDQPKEVVNSYIDKMLIKTLEDKLSEPHPDYGKILGYKVIK